MKKISEISEISGLPDWWYFSMPPRLAPRGYNEALIKGKFKVIYNKTSKGGKK